MAVGHPFARMDSARALLANGKSNRGHEAREILVPLVDVFKSLLLLCEVFALIGESYFIERKWESARDYLARAVAAGYSQRPSRRHKRMLADAYVELRQFEHATHQLRQMLDEIESPGGECSCCPRRP